MNEQKIGFFIQQLRKEKNLTQKDLADKLNITDKAVSKWERGLSCPDISLLIPLSELLGVSASELLSGEKKSEPPQKETETIIHEALVYSDKNTKSKFKKLRASALIIVTASFLLAAATCLICDFCITRKLTWSMIVIVSLIFGWLLLLPVLKFKDHIVKSTLIILSAAIIPYLIILGLILHVKLVYTLGSAVSVISAVGLWCIYAVFRKFDTNKLRALGISFLVLTPFCWCITSVTNFFLRQPAINTFENLLNTIVLIILAAACLGGDYILSQRNETE